MDVSQLLNPLRVSEHVEVEIAREPEGFLAENGRDLSLYHGQGDIQRL